MDVFTILSEHTKRLQDEVRILKEKSNLSESSFRTALQNFMVTAVEACEVDIDILQEAKERHNGNLLIPDFSCISQDDSGLVGYIETKKINFDVQNYTDNPQIEKYKLLCDNILLTNYEDFVWINGTDVQKTSIWQEDKFIEIIVDFLKQKPVKIRKTKDLALKLAYYSRKIKDVLFDFIKEETSRPQPSVLYGIYQVFQKNLAQLSFSEFSDAFAQMTAFGFMLAKLHHPEQIISLENVRKLIPAPYSLISELLRYLDDVVETQDNRMQNYIKQLLGLMNLMDVEKIEKDLFTRQRERKGMFEESTEYIDPFIYFYEDFLAQYDKSLRKAKGVYYTPMPIVRLIVKLIDKATTENFGFSEGIADKNVTALDFACGTGTFMVEYAAQALEKQPKSLQKRYIKDRLLLNLKGFEYLAGVYTIAILKFSQFLKKNYGYEIEKMDKIQIKLTNTIEDEQINFNPIFPLFSQEGIDADQIKKGNILVVMGNPPYSIGSKNKSQKIMELMEYYKKGLGEKSLNTLSDDYIKFIRFAHEKIRTKDKGIVGVITNNSFLDGTVHRKMRETLLQDFDKIYVINLHGNSLRKEGDKNVFDITVGVCITIFVKTTKAEQQKGETKKPCEVYYFSTKENKLIKRAEKYQWAEQTFEALQDKKNSIETSLAWKNLTPQAPYFFFLPKDLKQQADYEQFWSLKDIFGTISIGIGTERDSVTIHKTEESLLELKNNFLKRINLEKYDITEKRDWKFNYAVENLKSNPPIHEINYRLFDKKFTFYSKKSKGFLSYPRYEVMQHFILSKNIGLVFTRMITSPKFQHSFVTDKITERCFISNRGSEANYIAPLYLYKENTAGDQGVSTLGKTENFTSDFRKYIDQFYGEGISAEQILGYIYAVLYSETYRDKYKELLKIDFPRIPFVESKDEFLQTAAKGWHLVQMHLLNEIPDLPIAELKHDGKEANFTVQKPVWQNEKLYFNKTTYFDRVSKEVYDYQIGSYQVLQKYLKEREGVELGYDEIVHLQKVIKVLAGTKNY